VATARSAAGAAALRSFRVPTWSAGSGRTSGGVAFPVGLPPVPGGACPALAAQVAPVSERTARALSVVAVWRIDCFVPVVGFGVRVGAVGVDGGLLSLGHGVAASWVVGGMRCRWHAEEVPPTGGDAVTTRLARPKTSPVRCVPSRDVPGTPSGRVPPVARDQARWGWRTRGCGRHCCNVG
jgi:hypothetical protein